MPLVDGLECDYFYDKSECHVPDLGALTPGKRSALNSFAIIAASPTRKLPQTYITYIIKA